MKTTVKEQIREMLADKVPPWCASALLGYQWNDAERWVKDAQGVAILERRYHEVLLNGILQLKRVAGIEKSGGAFSDLTVEQESLLLVAREMAAKDMLHRAKFWQAITSDKFFYVTTGHVCSPDSFHVYNRDHSSPSGACLAVSGSQNADFVNMLTAAGRRPCGSAAGM